MDKIIDRKSVLSSLSGRDDHKKVFFYFLYLSRKRHDGSNNDPALIPHVWPLIEDHDFEPKELGSILLNIGRHANDLNRQRKTEGWKNHTAFIRENFAVWEDKACDKIQKFDPQALSNSMLALCYLQQKPSERFMAAFYDRLEQVIDEFNEQNIANLFFAMASLGECPPDHIFAKLADHAHKASNPCDVNQQHIANTQWACAVFSVMGKDHLVRPLAEDIFNIAQQMQRFKAVNLQQIKESSMWFGWETKHDLPEERGQTSRFEVALLQKFGLAAQSDNAFAIARNQAIHDALGRDVDISARNPAGRYLHAELDGCYHYVTAQDGTRRLNGGTMLQSALLSKIDPDAVILRWGDDFNDIIRRAPEHQHVPFVSYAAARAFALPAGVYSPDIRMDEAGKRQLVFDPVPIHSPEAHAE